MASIESAKNEYGIIWLLPEVAANYQRQLAIKIEQAFKLTGDLSFRAPAHITMKYRFEAAEIGRVERVLQDYCAVQKKCKWALRGFNFFKNDDDFVVFIDVIPSEETREAHDRFLTALRQIEWMQWGAFDHADLHYHVTLAHRGLTADNFKAVWTFINQQDPPDFELFFDNLTLLKIEGDRHAIYKKYWFLDGGGDDIRR